MSIIEIRQSLQSALREASRVVRLDFECALKNGVHIDEKDSKTGLPDFVTATDKRSEEIIKNQLSSSNPNIAFVGEESGGALNDDGYFLVDPLDGTSNFMSLRSYFSICTAYIERGEVLASAIADPMSGNILSAEKGNGIYMNGNRLLPIKDEKRPLARVQFECELALGAVEDFEIAQKILPHTSGLRKSGSTALDIMHLATGREIVLIANNLEPYDIAAALLIAEEAACTITDFEGKKTTIKTKEIIAARPSHHSKLLRLVKN